MVNMKESLLLGQAAKFADIQTFSDDSDITSGVFQVNSHNDYDL